jgi:hypothetical protein
MQSGLDAEQALLQQNQTQSTQLLADPTGTGDPEQNCEYNAAANYPTLSQAISPTLTCALTDPLNSSYGLLVWAGIAVAALALFGALKR